MVFGGIYFKFSAGPRIFDDLAHSSRIFEVNFEAVLILEGTGGGSAVSSTTSSSILEAFGLSLSKNKKL